MHIRNMNNTGVEINIDLADDQLLQQVSIIYGAVIRNDKVKAKSRLINYDKLNIVIRPKDGESAYITTYEIIEYLGQCISKENGKLNKTGLNKVKHIDPASCQAQQIITSTKENGTCNL